MLHYSVPYIFPRCHILCKRYHIKGFNLFCKLINLVYYLHHTFSKVTRKKLKRGDHKFVIVKQQANCGILLYEGQLIGQVLSRGSCMHYDVIQKCDPIMRCHGNPRWSPPLRLYPLTWEFYPMEPGLYTQ